MGIFDLFKKSNKQPKPGNYPVYLYTEEELDEYESYIEACLGSFDHQRGADPFYSRKV